MWITSFYAFILSIYVTLLLQEDAEKRAEWKSNTLFEHDKSVGAVVVGLDPYVNYHKLQYATLCVRENPGCLFIATNRDAVGHMTDLQEWPVNFVLNQVLDVWWLHCVVQLRESLL
ncbi:Phosphoglycolate phosphatase 2 [Linum perenne]